MAKKSKEKDMNLYYLNEKGQATRDDIDILMQKKKAKEREKRIKENNKKEKQSDIDSELETVIGMTNKNRVRKDEEERKKISKNQRKLKKRRRKIKIFFEVFISLFIIIGSIIFAMTSPIFNIKDIKVTNNSLISSETITSLSGLATGQNIFRFWSKNVEDGIKENAYIESVKIHRNIPSTIEIEVEERTPTYSLDYLGKYAYINNQGYILEISDDSKQLPIILGISTKEEEVVPKNRLNNTDLKRIEDVMKIMNVVKENGLYEKVTSIDIRDENEYIINIESESKKIHLGDTSNLSNKILYVLAIMEQEKEVEGEIFVNGDLNNKFQPYFRQKV